MSIKSKKAPQVILYPYQAANQYIDLNKKVLGMAGSEILDIRDVLHTSKLLKRSNRVAIVNWMEDSPYASYFPSWAAPFRLVKCIILILLFKLLASKVIWVRHNFKAHNRNRTSFYFRCISKLLKLVSHSTVFLEQYPVKEKADICVPHPSYETSTEQQLSLSADKNGEKRDIPIAFYGVIKPYKNLHNLLAQWPVNEALMIRGHCENVDYEKTLLDIVRKRGLKIDYENTFLDDEGLEGMLIRTKYILLPHETNSMIAPGMFYHGISFGCNVLASNTEFGQHKQQQHEFVSLFNMDSLSIPDLEKVYVTPKKVIDSANTFYAKEVVAKHWLSLFKNVFQ